MAYWEGMKKTSTILLVLSFLFALSAMAIALAGTFSLKRQTALIAQEVEEDLAELDEQAAAQLEPELPEGYVLNENTNPVVLTLEELGFTFLAPNEWGAFELVYQPGTFKGSGTYSGWFENNPDITFEATDPTFVPARGGYWADILGYRKTSEGYETNFIKLNWSPLSESLVQGEVQTENGTVLVVSADAEAEGPMMFSDEEGARFAIMNFSFGPLPGGVFRAGAKVSRDDFREFLESLEFVATE